MPGSYSDDYWCWNTRCSRCGRIVHVLDDCDCWVDREDPDLEPDPDDDGDEWRKFDDND